MTLNLLIILLNIILSKEYNYIEILLVIRLRHMVRYFVTECINFFCRITGHKFSRSSKLNKNQDHRIGDLLVPDSPFNRMTGEIIQSDFFIIVMA